MKDNMLVQTCFSSGTSINTETSSAGAAKVHCKTAQTVEDYVWQGPLRQTSQSQPHTVSRCPVNSKVCLAEHALPCQGIAYLIYYKYVLSSTNTQF